MAHEIAYKHRKEVKRIQKNIEDAHKYWLENRENFHRFKKAVYKTSLDEKDRETLRALGKPDLEFNVLEAYISRLKGEWSKQTPSFQITSQEINPRQNLTLAVLEGYLQAILTDANLNGFSDKLYDDTLSGGYSIMKVRMDYAHDESFDQVPYLEKILDPTLAGFDPLAREPTKWDANFAYELYPMFKEDFERDYPDVDLTSKKFANTANQFNWTYMVGGQEVILVADYYEKKKTSGMLYLLSNGQKVTMAEYNKLKEQFVATIAEIPAIVDERHHTKTKIERYRIMDGLLLEHDKTDFYRLPLIFTDGNSAYLTENADQTKSSQAKQFTRPYLYHAMDMQKLKNFAGQTLAAGLENFVQSKFIAAEQTISPQNMDAWIHPQKMSTLIYNDIDGNGRPLPKPEAIAMAPLPPEIFATFDAADKTIQNILGSYDAALGLSQGQLSGVAIVEGATQSNATAMPYVMNYLLALTQAGQVILDVLPMHLKTPRTIPIVNAKGERFYVPTGDPALKDELDFELEPNSLNVVVKAGPNFEIQKNRALQTLTQLMNTSEVVKAMMETEGLPILMDNLDIRGQNELKQMAVTFMEKRAKAQEEAQQQAQAAQQQNPMEKALEIEDKKAQIEAQKVDDKRNYDQQKLENDKLELAMKESKQRMDAFDKILRNLVRMAEAETKRDTQSSKFLTEEMKFDKSLLKDILNPNP